MITVAGVSPGEAAAAVATALRQLGGAPLLGSIRDAFCREVSGGVLLRLESAAQRPDAAEKLAHQLHGFVLPAGTELLCASSPEIHSVPMPFQFLDLLAKVESPARLSREVRL